MEEIKEELQQIVKEYFEKQSQSELTLCIYEEKTEDDIEWFYDENKKMWCYFKIVSKKDKETGDRWEEIKIVEKRHKTFGKNCSILEMSFFNFMTIKTMEYFNTDDLCVSDVNTYIEKYDNAKKEKPDIKISELKDYLKEKDYKQRAEKTEKTINFFMWPLTIILLFTPIFPLAFFTCPLTYKYKLIEKIKNKFSKGKINNGQ